MTQIFKQFSILFFALAFFACSSSKEMNNVINNDDPDEGPKQRLELANQYYDDGDFFKAIQLYEIVINENIMVNDLEEVYFRYANAHFAQYDYATASNLYNSFYLAYPDSESAETAYYYRALCSYNMAEDDYRLDQSTMVQAMREFQDYAITFPEGEFKSEAQLKIEEIKIANERKDLSIGQLYYQIEEYKAAISEFNRFIEDNPSSQLVEEAYFLMLQARYELAINSYANKQKERFDLVKEHYGYFMDKYSTGPYANQAKEINKVVEQELNQL